MLLSAASTSVAQSQPWLYARVVVRNYSEKPVWVDISWAYKNEGWRMDREFCLQPRQMSSPHTILYRSPELGPEMRVRAEIKNGSDCGGSNIELVQIKESVPVVKAIPLLQAIVDKPNATYSIAGHWQFP
jgi:hypothetical protein